MKKKRKETNLGTFMFLEYFELSIKYNKTYKNIPMLPLIYKS